MGDSVPNEREHQQHTSGTPAPEGPEDVLLDVSELHIDSIELQVSDLRAHVSLMAEVLNLLRLNIGVDANLGQVWLDIRGVQAQALLKVRLDKVAEILNRVLATLETRPEIVEHLVKSVGHALEDVGRGVGQTLPQVGQGIGQTLPQVGQAVGQTLPQVGRGAGQAAEQAAQGVGQAAGQAARDVGYSTSQQAGQAAHQAGEAAQQAGQGAVRAAQQAGQGRVQGGAGQPGPGRQGQPQQGPQGQPAQQAGPGQQKGDQWQDRRASATAEVEHQQNGESEQRQQGQETPQRGAPSPRRGLPRRPPRRW